MVCFRVVRAFSVAMPAETCKKRAAKVQHGSPNNPTPPRLGFGSYCIRAEAAVFDQGVAVGSLRGYDSSLEIIKEVEGRCRADIRHRGLECGETSVVILTNVDNMVCEGVYFTIDDHSVRLF